MSIFLNVLPGYDSLADVLKLALDQAQTGKGKARHGVNQGIPRAFTEQPILTIARMHGIGYQTGQACKKAHEATELPEGAAQAELLGAINYLAAAYILLEERRSEKAKPDGRNGEISTQSDQRSPSGRCPTVAEMGAQSEAPRGSSKGGS